MDDFDSNRTEKYRERTEEIDCPFCGKAKITVTFVAGYVSWKVSRIASGSKRTRFFHEPKTRVHSNCPNCKATKQEIRDIIEKGVTQKQSHEERIKRIRETGLPTVIEV